MPFYSLPVTPRYRFPVLSSLRFAGNMTDQVDHGSAGSLDDMTTQGGFFWIRPVGLSSSLNHEMMEKTPSSFASFKSLTTTGTGQLLVDFSVTGGGGELRSRSVDNLLQESEWAFVGYTWDGNTSNAIKLYYGTRNTVVSELSSYNQQIAPGGTYNSDAGQNHIVGKHPDPSTNGFKGDIAWHGMWNVVPSIDQIRAIQLGQFPSGCVLDVPYGINGTSTQTDRSASANNGTVTGALVSGLTPFVRQAAAARRGCR